MDEEYTQSDISKVVQELMDDPENPMSFAEAVKEAMAQGYRDGGLTIQIQRLAEGGGVGSLMQPKQNRVGLFMGGDPLTGQAKMIYNSMSSYGYDDQTIADALKTQGLLPTSGTTPPGTTPPGTTPPPGSGGGGSGDGGGDGGASTTTRDTLIDMGIKAAEDDKGSLMSDELISKTIPGLQIPDRNRGMEDNENFIDRANPTNDSRIVSEEMGLVGGIPDRNRGQTISPQVQEVLSAVSRPTMADIAGPKAGTVDNSISIEDLSKPSNIGDFAITGAPDLTNQTGILDAPPSISMAQDPNVEDPFGGKYTPSFEEKKAVEGILAGLLDKAQGYDIKDALKPENLTTALIGSQLGKFLGVPGVVGSFALNTLKNQSDARKEKKAIAAEKAKKEAEAAQAKADKAEKKRKDDIAKRDATAAAKKAASEGKAYEYKGRDTKQGTHTSTISKEKAEDNREAGRGQPTPKSTTKSPSFNIHGGGSGPVEGLGPNSVSNSVSRSNTNYGQFGRRQSATRGGGGNSPGCFIKGTLITMLDGTKKPVEQVDLGNEVAVGGKVFAVGRFLNTELYDYKGIKVSGSHMVNEDGTWMRVRDTKHGKSLGDGQNTVYVFGSENRRILINDILFTDYFETKEQEKLIDNEKDFFNNWQKYGNTIDEFNVDTINAS